VNCIFREDPEAAGVAITHGTATLEETAYFLNLTVRSRKVVALTGAQRPPTAMSNDADLNLLDCLRTAVSPAAQGKGVLVVMNNEIHAARDVTKTDALRVDTMRSRSLGALGYCDSDGQVVFYRQPVRTHTAESEFDVTDLDKLPRVDIAPAYAGADGLLVDALANAGVSGIVAAALGAGLAPRPYMQALDAAVKRGIVVLFATQTGSGRVVFKRSLLDHGFLVADNLTPKKARILLMLALARTNDSTEIQRMALTY
jgi:L-asparaginase